MVELSTGGPVPNENILKDEGEINVFSDKNGGSLRPGEKRKKYRQKDSVSR